MGVSGDDERMSTSTALCICICELEADWSCGRFFVSTLGLDFPFPLGLSDGDDGDEAPDAAA